uniref:Protein kinase domain-containing protein n=1 Tax=Oxyrrhis marina TaxID=2969 RepID=A0A7S3UIQ5_OXYMA
MPLEPMQEVVVDPKLKPFLIPKRYELVKKLGSGAYGCVASFKDATTGEKVAVKKIQNAYADVIDGKRILREIRLMRHFKHDNVSRIRDLIPPNKPQHDDIYIVMDLMETDLHRVIHSKQPLTEEHFQYFLYQILKTPALSITCRPGLPFGIHSRSTGAGVPSVDRIFLTWSR